MIQGMLAQLIAEERRAAAAEEREACARIAEEQCDAWDREGDGESVTASQRLYGMAEAGHVIAAGIRARKHV